MTKAVLISLGLATLALFPAAAPAQDTSTAAVNEAVLRQAKAIDLRQKLTDAKAVAQRGDMVNAAKLYQESVTLAQQIGLESIPNEWQQAVSGLAATRLELARQAQSRGDYLEAQTQVQQVLNVDPKNPEAIAFKQRNDQMMIAMKGRIPDTETMSKAPQMRDQKIAADTLVQDGKLFYEMGKFTDAEAKLTEALKMDPDNSTAAYYLNVIKQAKFQRDSVMHNTDTQERMERVERQWILPKPTASLPTIGNGYAHPSVTVLNDPARSTNGLVWTGSGRQAIVAKLDHIRMETFSTGDSGVPLSEVIKQLTEQTKLRDPERKGINFLINNNPDLSGSPIDAGLGALGGLGGVGGGAGGGGGFGGGLGGGGFGGARFGGGAAGGGGALDPNTGLPIAPAGETPATTEPLDIGSTIVKIPSLTDVRLADLLDAIVMVADRVMVNGQPQSLKYSILDYGIVFALKGPETPQLFMRTFRVDPNTFYSGLENVSAQSFGAVTSTGGGGGAGGGGGGGGGAGGQQNGGAVVGVVNAFSGAGTLRNTGQGGGGGGGGGGSQGGSGSLLSAGQSGGGQGGAGGGGGGANAQNAGGLAYITAQTSAQTPSQLARLFFSSLGVNLLQPVGKSVFFNDRLGVLFVKATEDDLDTIERALQVLNQVPPQVHIKARFIEVQQSDSKALGFDWYLGQFNMGQQAVGSGGTSPSLTVPTSAANPLGAFPGNTAANLIPGAATDQLLTGGLRESTSVPTLATFTGILTDPEFPRGPARPPTTHGSRDSGRTGSHHDERSPDPDACHVLGHRHHRPDLPARRGSHVHDRCCGHRWRGAIT